MLACRQIWEQADPSRSEIAQRYENVQNFLRVVTGMGMPSDCQFSCADLESEGWEDRPRVADCLLWLKRLHSNIKYLFFLCVRKFWSRAPQHARPPKHNKHRERRQPTSAATAAATNNVNLLRSDEKRHALSPRPRVSRR